MSRRAGLLAGLRSSGSGIGAKLGGPRGTLLAAGAVFLLVAGVGAATSYLRDAPQESSASQSQPRSDALARLEDYTRSVGTKHTASAPDAGKMLPDVSTMIKRLAARLETAPDDVKGWRMLGWSYYHTERYAEAAGAYAKAVALEPDSAELKRAYEEAKAKASGSGASDTTAAPPPVAVAKSGDGHDSGPDAKQTAAFEAMPAHERSAAIRAMVDGLADRLERSPRDVEGWTRLMRSRIVLGETEVAAAAFRKALDVFKDDTVASARINAAAKEFGLKTD
jgi:cytochrome c-type biogenesis protein CcmH